MEDTASLRIFCSLVEAGSFTLAAEREFISQSAVSQRLRALERAYGQVLIDRGRGRGRVSATPAGKALYAGAKSLLAQMASLEAQLRSMAEEIAGTIRVATVYSVGLHSLPGRLKPFLAANPRVNVHLEYSQTIKVYHDVGSGTVDIGIVACPAKHSGIDIVPFGADEMVLICPPEHPLANRQDVRLAETDGLPFIAFAADIPTRKLTDKRLRDSGARPKVVMEFDNIETIKNLVEIGSGVALVPENSVHREVREGALAIARLHPRDAFQRPCGLLLRSAQSRRPAVEAFVEAVREQTTASQA